MSWNRKPPLRTVTVALLATQVLSFAQEQERDEEPELDLSIWDYSVNLRGGLGYKDNVLLSNIDQQGSAFWQSALDAMLFRVDLENGGNLTLFLSAEDRRYFSDIEVEKEQLVLAQGKYERPFAEEWFWSATAQYLYVDQVFDASATEQLLVTLPVKSHNYQLAPAIGRNLHWNDRLELKLVAERQHFNQPLDDYWEFGPQLIYSRSYGHKSEVTASYTFDQRNYDTREQLDLDFASIPDTSLRYQQHEFELGLNHSWDTDRRWRSRAKFLFEINSDNGVGFYDYKRYRFSKRIGYYGDDWLATLEARVLHYDYDVQPVEETGEIRSNWEYVIAARAEKKIWKKLSLFGDVEYELAESNYSLEEYSVTTLMGGVDWEF
jgi:hypothetical protein